MFAYPEAHQPGPAEVWEPATAASEAGEQLAAPQDLPAVLSVFELFPKRNPPWGLLLFAAAITSLLVAGYRGLGAASPLWVEKPLPAFALEGPGNLASCVSTLILSLAAVCTVLIWWLLHAAGQRGRHIWLLAAAWWFYLGVDESTGLHLTFGPVLRQWFAMGEASSPWWWAASYLFISAAILSRLVLDLRYSAWASFWMTLAVVLYGVSGIVQIDLLPAVSLPADRVICEEICELVGHWCLLLSMMSFGQFLLVTMGDDLPRAGELTGDPDQAGVPPPDEAPLVAPVAPPATAAATEAAREGTGTPTDYLIIHPPHGQGPPVAVPRGVTRLARRRSPSRSAQTTTRRRSDLDSPRTTRSARQAQEALPATGPTGVTYSVSSSATNPAVVQPTPPATGLNAFQAGMAAAEARQAAAAAMSYSQTVATGAAPSPVHNPPAQARQTIAQTVTPAVERLSRQTSNPSPGPLRPPAGDTAAEMPPPTPSRFAGETLASTGGTQAKPPVTVALTGGARSPGQAAPVDAGNLNAAAGAMKDPQGTGTAAVSSTGTGPSLPPLPARRLTKEEKKRLKQLYKQRMAQLENQD